MEALIDYGGLSALSLFAVAFSAPPTRSGSMKRPVITRTSASEGLFFSLTVR